MWTLSLQLGIARAVRSILLIREQKKLAGKSMLTLERYSLTPRL
jgi:hypothetical protein